MKKSGLISLVTVFVVGVGLLSGCTSPLNIDEDSPSTLLESVISEITDNKNENYTSTPRIDTTQLRKTSSEVQNMTSDINSFFYGTVGVASQLLNEYGEDAYNSSYDIEYTKDYTQWYHTIAVISLSIPSKIAMFTSEDDEASNILIASEIDTSEVSYYSNYTMRYYFRVYYDKVTESRGWEFVTYLTNKSTGNSGYSNYFYKNGQETIYISPNKYDPTNPEETWDGYVYYDDNGSISSYSELENSNYLESYYESRIEVLNRYADYESLLNRESQISTVIEFDEDTFLDIALPSSDKPSGGPSDDPDDPYKYIEDDGSITLSNQLELAKIIFSKLGTNTKTPEEAIQLEYEEGLFDETEGTLLAEDDEIYTTGRSMIYSIDYVYTELLNDEGTNIFTSSYEVDYDIIFTREEGSKFSSITLFAPKTIYYSSVVAYDGVYYFISSYLNASANGAIIDVLISYDPVSDEVYTQLYGSYPKLSGDYTYIDYMIFTDNLHPLMAEDLSSIMKPGVVFVDSTYKYVLSEERVPEIYEYLIELMNNQYSEYSTIEGLVADITRARRIYYSSMTLDDIERDTGISYPRLDESWS